MIEIVRSAARGSPFYRPYVRWKYRLSSKARRSYFAGMYSANLWGDPESRSGSGSNLASSESIREALPSLLRDLGAKSLLDIPCGDWAWMQYVDLTGIDYIGGDIVPSLIGELREWHSATRREFRVLDALSSDLPPVDAVLIRDLLGHLDNRQVRLVLQNVKRSNATWLLATHYPDVTRNEDVGMGGWRPQNLTLPPYDLPEPVRLIREPVDDRPDKTLAVWELAAFQ